MEDVPSEVIDHSNNDSDRETGGGDSDSDRDTGGGDSDRGRDTGGGGRDTGGGDSDTVRDTVIDSDLVSRMRRGDSEGFDIIYARYRDRVWGFLRRLSGATGLAEDLFQETWLAAARNAHRLREDTRLLPWLFTIARNKHRNALRFMAFDRERVARAATRSELVGSRAAPIDDAVAARERVGAVGAVFLRLPGAYREVLLLCVVEGLDAAETARILDIREDAVRKRLSRARAELATRLAETPGKGRPK